MSLLNREPISIGRAARALRDDRVFVVATDDTYAPLQYFKYLSLSRVKVVVLETPAGSGFSSPGHVVDRLKAAFNGVKQRGEIQDGDEFWIFLDTDHHFTDNHRQGTLNALQTATQSGFEIAVSNPCFELWLLLHHECVNKDAQFSTCAHVEQRLETILGSYNKNNVKEGQFPIKKVADAIRRARALESNPDDPAGHWPVQVGTRVFRLLERVLSRNQ